MPEKQSIVYIPTALYAFDKRSSKSRGEQRRRAKYDIKIKASLLSEIFDIKDIKILDLDKDTLPETKSEIHDIFHDASIVYVDGGNTFYLQAHILKSNFWKHINPYLDQGCLYIGASAGAIVAGKSVQTAYWKGWDDPDVLEQEMKWNDSTLKGRGLCDKSIFPHYHAASHRELVDRKSVDECHSVYTLSDNECLLLSCQKSIDDNHTSVDCMLTDYKPKKLRFYP